MKRSLLMIATLAGLLMVPTTVFAQCGYSASSRNPGAWHDLTVGTSHSGQAVHGFTQDEHNHACGMAAIDLDGLDLESVGGVYDVLQSLDGAVEGTATAFLDVARGALLIGSCDDITEIVAFVPLSPNSLRGVAMLLAEEDQ